MYSKLTIRWVVVLALFSLLSVGCAAALASEAPAAGPAAAMQDLPWAAAGGIGQVGASVSITATKPLTSVTSAELYAGDEQLEIVEEVLGTLKADGLLSDAEYQSALEGLRDAEGYLNHEQIEEDLETLEKVNNDALAKDPNCVPCAAQKNQLAEAMKGLASGDPAIVAASMAGLKQSLNEPGLDKLLVPEAKALALQALEQSQGVLSGTTANLQADAAAAGQKIAMLTQMLEKEEAAWPPAAYEQIHGALTSVGDLVQEAAAEDLAEAEGAEGTDLDGDNPDDALDGDTGDTGDEPAGDADGDSGDSGGDGGDSSE